MTTVLENVYNVSVIYTAGFTSDQISSIGFDLDELKVSKTNTLKNK